MAQRSGSGHTRLAVVDDASDGDADADDHLRELHRRDEEREALRKLARPISALRDPEIEVHDRVHRVVHGGKPDARADPHRVRVPAVEQHRDVMVPADGGVVLDQPG